MKAVRRPGTPAGVTTRVDLPIPPPGASGRLTSACSNTSSGASGPSTYSRLRSSMAILRQEGWRGSFVPQAGELLLVHPEVVSDLVQERHPDLPPELLPVREILLEGPPVDGDLVGKVPGILKGPLRERHTVVEAVQGVFRRDAQLGKEPFGRPLLDDHRHVVQGLAELGRQSRERLAERPAEVVARQSAPAAFRSHPQILSHPGGGCYFASRSRIAEKNADHSVRFGTTCSSRRPATVPQSSAL